MLISVILVHRLFSASCWHPIPVAGDKNVLFFLVQGKHIFHWNFYALLLGRKGEGTGPFLHLNCLQLKITNMLN